MKVPRSKSEPGKGGFWRLDPEYASNIVNGVFKKRRPPFLRPGYKKKARASQRPVPSAVAAPAASFCVGRLEPARTSVWDASVGQQVEVEALRFSADGHTAELFSPSSLTSMIELSPESLVGGEEEMFCHSELSDASSESPDSLASSIDLSLYGPQGALPQAPLHASDLSNVMDAMDPAQVTLQPVAYQNTPNWEISRALSMLDPGLDLDGLIDMEGIVTSI